MLDKMCTGWGLIKSDGELYPFCCNEKEGREKKEGPSQKKLLL